MEYNRTEKEKIEDTWTSGKIANRPNFHPPPLLAGLLDQDDNVAMALASLALHWPIACRRHVKKCCRTPAKSTHSGAKLQ